MVQKAAADMAYDVTNVPITEGDDYSLKPVQLVLTERLDKKVRAEVNAGLDSMKFVQLDMKLIDCDVGGKLKQPALCSVPDPSFACYVLLRVVTRCYSVLLPVVTRCYLLTDKK